ncbi:SDR family NAD(P)-dependent oxidoreductase [Rhizobium leguminosarum]|uniref:SDR family NAD(P)-dependent oxidoreductase n=1 Tax=Rhizobium leguminosarum TaxID=384 RepID=UPI0036DE5E20
MPARCRPRSEPHQQTRAAMTSLTGKTIIIFGGSSGIGLGVAAATLERGANVVIAGRSEEKLQAAEEELGGPPRLRSFAADLEREADSLASSRRLGSSTTSLPRPARRRRAHRSKPSTSTSSGASSTTS